MQRPFEHTIVDALLANSLQGALRIEARDPADPPYRAEALAAQILTKPYDARAFGYDGSMHVSAGFRLAMRLCCRVLAEPLRSQPGGVRRDVQLVLTWLERWREERR